MAISTALSGLQAAGSRFATSAKAVSGAAPISVAREGLPAPERPSGVPDISLQNLPETDLVQNLVDLKFAAINYKANAKTLAAIAKTEKNLLDILS